MTRARDLADLASSGVIEGTEVADDAITYAKIQNVSADERILGRVSGADGVIEELTKAQMLTMMNVADGSNANTHPNHSGEVTSTADGATVKASNIVDEDNLKVSNSPTNGYALTAQSGNTGGMTWASVGGAADNYFASSGLSSKDLGTGLHIKTSDSGASVSTDFDELVIESSSIAGISILAGTGDDSGIDFGDSGGSQRGRFIYAHNGDNMMFHTAGGERMRITSGGIIGVGANGASADLGVGIHIKTADSGGTSIEGGADDFVIEGSQPCGMTILSPNNHSGNINFADNDAASRGIINYDHGSDAMNFYAGGTLTANLRSTGMRLGSSGIPDTWCHIDGNSDESTGSLTMATPSRINMSNGATRDVINFGETSGYVRGKITHTVGSGVTYNSSSDYRLKENEVSISNGIERIKQLKPYRFNWKAVPDETVDGFFAHEVSSLVPEAVSGTKDAMADKLRVVLDKDGNYLREGVWEENWEKGKLSGEFPSDSTWNATKEYPEHQQMDNARLVPLLTASLQEAITKIETLEAKVTALENA